MSEPSVSRIRAAFLALMLAACSSAAPAEPPGDLVAADNTHPSQAGNDVIRDLLIDADLSDGLGP